MGGGERMCKKVGDGERGEVKRVDGEKMIG